MRKRQAQQARQALLWGVGLFVLLQLMLAAAIEYWLPGLRDPDYGYKINRLSKQMRTAPRGPLIVMLGSSRTLNGLRADDLRVSLARQLGQRPVVFNFGVAGDGPYAELVHLRRLLGLHIRPDVLLIEVLPPVLHQQYRAGIARYPVERLWYRDLPMAQRYQDQVKSLRTAWLLSNLLPAFAHRYAIVSRLAPLLLPDDLRQDWAHGMDPSGWLALTGKRVTMPAARRRATATALEEYQPLLQDFHPEGPECTALEELLETCHRERIAAALVLMPEGSTFRALYSPSVLQELNVYLQRLEARYGVTRIDARRWIKDDGFWDSHHLLSSGATLFTARLGKEVIAPLLETHLATIAH